IAVIANFRSRRNFPPSRFKPRDRNPLIFISQNPTAKKKLLSENRCDEKFSRPIKRSSRPRILKQTPDRTDFGAGEADEAVVHALGEKSSGASRPHGCSRILRTIDENEKLFRTRRQKTFRRRFKYRRFHFLRPERRIADRYRKNIGSDES